MLLHPSNPEPTLAERQENERVELEQMPESERKRLITHLLGLRLVDALFYYPVGVERMVLKRLVCKKEKEIKSLHRLSELTHIGANSLKPILMRTQRIRVRDLESAPKKQRFAAIYLVSTQR